MGEPNKHKRQHRKNATDFNGFMLNFNGVTTSSDSDEVKNNANYRKNIGPIFVNPTKNGKHPNSVGKKPQKGYDIDISESNVWKLINKFETINELPKTGELNRALEIERSTANLNRENDVLVEPTIYESHTDKPREYDIVAYSKKPNICEEESPRVLRKYRETGTHFENKNRSIAKRTTNDREASSRRVKDTEKATANKIKKSYSENSNKSHDKLTDHDVIEIDSKNPSFVKSEPPTPRLNILGEKMLEGYPYFPKASYLDDFTSPEHDVNASFFRIGTLDEVHDIEVHDIVDAPDKSEIVDIIDLVTLSKYLDMFVGVCKNQNPYEDASYKHSKYFKSSPNISTGYKISISKMTLTSKIISPAKSPRGDKSSSSVSSADLSPRPRPLKTKRATSSKEPQKTRSENFATTIKNDKMKLSDYFTAISSKKYDIPESLLHHYGFKFDLLYDLCSLCVDEETTNKTVNAFILMYRLIDRYVAWECSDIKTSATMSLKVSSTS
jgi:hypothetical protein